MAANLWVLALVVQMHDIVTRANLANLAYDLTSSAAAKRRWEKRTHCILCGGRLR